ncbi:MULTISPECIES: L,D-transpeptidase family protein [Streptomyces]|uniref:L,D-TPase catalytic domain-containing protein n=1 Tax=Streptomyces bobili TaxID=67280 RepID=A0ABZ1QS62_9ACTN|nr:L,D-transpeptidase family protein [Streptomyces bobili]
MITHRARVALLAASLLLTGCGGGAAASPDHNAPAPATTSAAPGTPAPEAAARTVPRQLPGLGPKTRSAVPAAARQVVVVTGRGPDSPLSEVVLHRRTGTGWQPGPVWPAHNALRGWTDHHRAGDLRTPIGVYGLSDAGGRLPDPGTRLPYDRSTGGFRSPGTGFEGESLAGSFDHVIAIDYNREPGTSPLDWTRPLGAGRGGGIWIHVDHGGPTHGCVSIAERHMKDLLRALDPALHPVVVMGDHASLAR